MSHFAVLVKIPVEYQDNVLATIQDLLSPYSENDVAYEEFVPKDIEKDYEKYKKGKESLEEWAERNGYHKQGDSFGYMSNPNAKWDWFEVGGRWAGMLVLKKGLGVPSDGRGDKSWTWDHKGEDPYEAKDQREVADIAKIKDIDWPFLHKEAYKLAAQRYQEYRDWLKGGSTSDRDVHHFDMHSLAYSLGLVHRQADGEFIYKDVESEEEFFAKYAAYWEFSTYAVLDRNGWHSPGEMGWFGCSSEDPEDYLAWSAKYYERFIENEDPETVLAVVDCHI